MGESRVEGALQSFFSFLGCHATFFTLLSICELIDLWIPQPRSRHEAKTAVVRRAIYQASNVQPTDLLNDQFTNYHHAIASSALRLSLALHPG